MTYKIDFSKKFRQDYKKIANKPVAQDADKVIERLAQDEPLEARHRNHALKGEFTGLRECVASYRLLTEFCLRKTRSCIRCA